PAEDLIVDHFLTEGDNPISDDGWEMISTPGHTAGSACLVHHARRIIFTGDHLLPGESPGLGMGGSFLENPLSLMLHSLQRMRKLDGYLVLPVHGLPFRSLETASDAIRDHHLSRCRSVELAMDTIASSSATPSIWELAKQVPWRGGFQSLRGQRL